MEKIKVAVIGATGAVGQVFMWMLSEHPWFELVYITASAPRVNKKYGDTVHWLLPFEMPACFSSMIISEFNSEKMKAAGVKIVFSALPAEIAMEAEPHLRSEGFYVFSNASALRYEKDVPILIPETNLESLDVIREQGYPESGFVVTNSNCVVTGLAVAIAPLRKFGIKEVTVNSYQSVSGAGYPGLSSFDITDNVIPYIAKEEEKVEKEVKKILSVDWPLYAYCVRVPVMFGHLETVWLSFENDVSTDDILTAWEEFHDCSSLPSSPKQPIVYRPVNAFPQAKSAWWGNPKGMEVYTGRLKKKENRIGFVLLVNNLVRGSAGGSIQNAEAFVHRYGLRP